MNKMVRFFIILFGFFLFILLFFSPFSIVQAQECSLDRECGVTHQGGNYCCGDNVCNNEIRPFCSDGGCFIDSSLVIDHIDPCPYGCSGGACKPKPQVCTPNSQGAVCDTALCPNGDVCGQGHKYCLWDGSGYGDCSEEVNNCATQCPGPIVTPTPTSFPGPNTPTCSLNINPTSFTTGSTARYTVTSSNIPSGNSLYWGGKNDGTAITEFGPISGFTANTSWSVDYGAPAGSYERYGNIKWSGSNCQTNTVPITVCSVPSSPSSISVSCTNPGTSATISWPQVSGAAGYALRIDKDPNSWTGTATNGDVIDNNITGTSYTFNMSRETAASNYRVWVHTKNSCGGLSTSVAQTTFSCVPNCQITSSPAGDVLVDTAQTFNTTNTSSTGNTQGGFLVYNPDGTINSDFGFDPATTSSSSTAHDSTFRWTPTATGTYTAVCRAWNDTVAECRGGNKKDPGVAAQYDCSGPNASKTVRVIAPTVYSISGTMYVKGYDNISRPYTGGFTVEATDGGIASTGNTNGSYIVTSIPAENGLNAYQFTFSVPAGGYKVVSSNLSGWSCGEPWRQGEACPGPILYGSVLKSDFPATGETRNVANVNIYLEYAPTVSGMVYKSYGHDRFFDGRLPGAIIGLSYLSVNGNFEDWPDGLGLANGAASDRRAPRGWTLENPNNDGSYSHAGSGLEARSDYSFGRYPYGSAWVFGSREILVRPNRNYVLTGYVYFRPGDQNRGHLNNDLSQPIDTAKGAKACIFETCYSVQMVTGNPAVDNGWRKMRVAFNSNTNRFLKIRLGANVGATFFDDFNLSEEQTTDANGLYSFINLPLGTYTVKLVYSGNYTSQYYGSYPNSATAILTDENRTSNHVFVTTPLYSVRGNVFKDVNNDKKKNAFASADTPPDIVYQKDNKGATIALGNLLYNPSFETWTNGVGDPDNSYCNVPNTTIAGCNADPDNWHPSGSAYRIHRANGRLSGYSIQRPGSFYQDIFVKPNTTYRLSGWVKAESMYWRINDNNQPDLRAQICAKTTSGTVIQCVQTQGSVGDPWTYIQVPDFNSGVNDIIRIYADVNFDMTTYWDDFDLSEIKTTDTAGNYRFDYSVISGSYTAKITDPSKVLYNTTPNITKTGGTGDYTAPVPTLNINETNNSLTIEKRIQYLYGLVIPPPVPAIAQPSCIFNGFSGNDGTKQLEISWTNNSFPVTWADISTDNFTTYYHKEIKSGNSTTGADGITRIDGTGFNDADGAANGDLGTLTYNPGTTYSVRLFNGGLNNDPPYPYFTPTICVPPKPTIVNSTCDSPGYSASMSWTASTGATAYALRINNKANGWCADGGGSCNYGNTGTNHNCTNFTGDYCLSFNGTTYSYNTTPGNSYDWWVHACNNAGCSQESQESTASFTCSYAKDPWIQVTGDVHSNTRIKAPGGP